MPIHYSQHKRISVRTIDGNTVTFQYNPGEGQKSNGAISEFITIGPGGVRVTPDQALVALVLDNVKRA